MLCKIFKSSYGKIQPISSWSHIQLAELHSLVGPPSNNCIFPSILWVLCYFKSMLDPNRECRKAAHWKPRLLHTVELIHNFQCVCSDLVVLAEPARATFSWHRPLEMSVWKGLILQFEWSLNIENNFIKWKDNSPLWLCHFLGNAD